MATTTHPFAGILPDCQDGIDWIEATYFKHNTPHRGCPSASSQSSEEDAPAWTALDIEIQPDADPPRTRFDALKRSKPLFAQTWKRTRTNNLKDQSASGYDMALER